MYIIVCTAWLEPHLLGTDWYKIRDGIITYAGIRGYTAVSYNYSDNWLTKWSNLKGAINNNRPLIYVVNNNHAMMALGYKVENGEKYVYIAYGIGADVWGWVPFSISSYVFDIYIY